MVERREEGPKPQDWRERVRRSGGEGASMLKRSAHIPRNPVKTSEDIS